MKILFLILFSLTTFVFILSGFCAWCSWTGTISTLLLFSDILIAGIWFGLFQTVLSRL
jgi:hypothetical protein